MNRLTQKEDCGNWCLKGLPWDKIHPGHQTLTQEDYERLYGALHKLLDYEETGLTPEEAERVNDFSQSQVAMYLGKYQDECKEREYWQ